MNTTHVPHVLSFKIRPVAPPNNLYSNIVLACMYVSRYIKLTDIISSLGVAHLMSVDINVCCRVDTIKV